MADIFISYKREDRQFAERLSIALEQLGFEVWWDLDLLAGEKYRTAIRKVIETCKAGVVLWSVRSVESDFVLDEATHAKERDVLCPARIDNTALPFGFGQFHTDDLSDWDGEQGHSGFQALVRAIEKKVGRKGRLGAPRTSETQSELEAFKAVQINGNKTSLEAFLRAYPQSALATFVRGQLEELLVSAPATTNASGTAFTPLHTPAPPSPPQRPPFDAAAPSVPNEPRPRKSPAWPLVAALAVAAGLALSGVLFWNNLRAEEAVRVAAAQAEEARQESARAQAAREAAEKQLSEAAAAQEAERLAAKSADELAAIEAEAARVRDALAQRQREQRIREQATREARDQAAREFAEQQAQEARLASERQRRERPDPPTGRSPGAATSPGASVSGSSVRLSWTPVSGATSYRVSLTDAISGQRVFEDRSTTSSSTTASVQPGRTYRWTVATCMTGCGAHSARTYFSTSAAAYDATQLNPAVQTAVSLARTAEQAANAAAERARSAARRGRESGLNSPRDGEGTSNYTSGDRYEGQYAADLRNGVGIYYNENAQNDNQRYEGEYFNDQRHGAGLMIYRSGDRYVGRWRNTSKSGPGVYRYADGRRFEGEYANGRRNGHGVLWDAQGRVSQQGVWTDGSLTSALTR